MLSSSLLNSSRQKVYLYPKCALITSLPFPASIIPNMFSEFYYANSGQSNDNDTRISGNENTMRSISPMHAGKKKRKISEWWLQARTGIIG